VEEWQKLEEHSKVNAMGMAASDAVGRESEMPHVSGVLVDSVCITQHDVALAREGQSLLSHLEGVASLAQRFAAPFGLGCIAYVCGVLHDLGKYSQAFKRYLRDALSGKAVTRGEVHHAWEGALVILREIGNDQATVGLADILANVVASHHGGLTDMISDSERVIPGRIDAHSKIHPEQMRDVMESKEAADILARIDWNAVRSEFRDVRKRCDKNSFNLHLVVKYLYSCLVDADRCNAAGIDTPDSLPDWDDMERRLDAKLA
jgi:CRISPR-associated endonuclease/helicase Cas3